MAILWTWTIFAAPGRPTQSVIVSPGLTMPGFLVNMLNT